MIPRSKCEIIDLGRMAYRAAYDVQSEVHGRVVSGDAQPTLIFVEHDPVITLGRRGNREHILISDKGLRELGIDVVQSDRGGDVTYHGPGQLVAYPILALTPMKLGVGSYMRWLEQRVIETLAVFGIEGQRDTCATGVWVGDAKICAMGVRVRRNVTLHGLALNVTTDLTHFQTIIPCGLACRPVTSMAKVLGASFRGRGSMDQVKQALIAVFRDAL